MLPVALPRRSCRRYERFRSRQTNDVAGFCLLDFDALESFEGKKLRDAQRCRRAVGCQQHCLVAETDTPAMDAPDRQASDVIVPIERSDDHLERLIGLVHWRRDMLDDRFEKRQQARARLAWRTRGDAVATDSVQHRHIERFESRAERQKEFVHLVENFPRACIAAIDFVDDDDRR